MFKEILQALTTFQDYKNAQTYIQEVADNNSACLEECATAVHSILIDKSFTPLQKFLALKFTNDLIETANHSWLLKVENEFLVRLEEIAAYRCNSQDEDRGKFFFTDNNKSLRCYNKVVELQQAGSSFFRYCLESLWVWSKWFPFDIKTGKISLFRIVVERLAFKGVRFAKLSQFQMFNVLNNLMVQRIPKEMLKELRLYIKDNLAQNIEANIYTTQNALQLYFKSAKDHNLKSLDTYPTLFKKAVELMKAGRLGMEVELRMKGSRMAKLQKAILEQTQHQKKANNLVSQQAQTFNQLLSEKEKLILHVKKVLDEKEELKKTIEQLQTTVNQQKKLIDQQAQHIKEVENQSSAQRVSQPPHSGQSNDAHLTSQQNQLEAAQRRENQLQRMQAQISQLQEIMKQQAITIDHHQSFRIKLDADIYDQQQKNMQQEQEIQMLNLSLNQSSEKAHRLEEHLNRYKEMLTKARQENISALQQKQEYIGKLESQTAQQTQRIEQLLEENDVYRKKLELCEKQIASHQQSFINQLSNIQQTNASGRQEPLSQQKQFGKTESQFRPKREQ